MRLEEFDKRLQQKLDELNPAFNEQDWIRLSKKMKAQKSPVLFSKRIGMILLLLFLVFFSTWMSFRGPGSEIKNQLKKEQLQVPAKLADASDYMINNTNESKSNLLQNQNEAIQSKSIGSSKKSQTEIHANGNTISNGTIPVITKSTARERKISNTHSVENVSFQSENSRIKTNDQIDREPSSDIASGNENPVLLQTERDDKLITNQASENVALGFSVVDPIQILATEGVVLDKTPLLKSKIKSLSGIKPSKWIIGFTGLGAASHFNTGLAFEIKTKNNISFGSGLVAQKYLEQHYVDQNDFTATNETDFTELIRPRHSKSVSFSNIRIKSMDVLLPLSLKYYFPLNTRFALFANASMQLTLYSKTIVNFQYLSPDSNIRMSESDFDQASNSATLINHFTFGAGIQREFRNVIFQTSFLIQKNNSNQPHITTRELAGQVGIFYKL